MKTDTNAIFLSLVDAVSSMDEVASVGKTGEPELPRAGEGDIDVCVYCDSIPRLEKRGNALRSLGLQSFDLGASRSQHWGVVDFADLNGIETYLMYFTLDETVQSVDSIVNGERLEKEDHYFYPTGRLAMLRDINILFDRHGFLTRMKTNLLRLSCSNGAQAHCLSPGSTARCGRSGARCPSKRPLVLSFCS